MKKLSFAHSIMTYSLAIFALSASGAEKCKWQENCDCKSPGTTLRWEYAYCMAKLGVTDAKAQIDKLNKCSRDAMPSGYEKMTACAKNQFWRTKICDLDKSRTQCMTEDKEIPAFIEKGS